MDSNLREGLIFGLGNPLLDISASVSNAFLAKWGLEPNNAILADERHNGLVDEVVKQHEVKFIAGGSVQNTMRITQWLLPKDKVCTFMGCVGNDFFGRCMEARAVEDGVSVNYMVDPKVKTGHCVVLISENGKCRSLVAFLLAANNFKVEHVKQHWHVVSAAQYFYISGFHVTVSMPSILAVAKHVNEQPDKVLLFNLSAPFISAAFGEQLLQVFPYVDILFGNETEAVAFAALKKYTTSCVKEIAQLMAREPRANRKPRMVVITQGSDPVLVVKEGKLHEFAVKKLPEQSIVDTNGAGDAFVAGFLSQYAQRKPLDECVRVGIYAAQQIIKQDGSSTPKYAPDI